MGSAILFFSVAAVGIFIASEFILARSSRWEILAQKFRNAGAPPNGWRGSRFLQFEIQEGNVLKRTIYRERLPKSPLDSLWIKLFPKVQASAGPSGLYLKRRPWNFKHPAVLIPWNCVSSVQSSGATEFATDSVGRQLGLPGQAFRANLPKAVSGIVDKLAGDVVEFRLSNPSLRIHLPASVVGNVDQYVGSKSKAPVRPPSSLVGAV